MVDSGAGFSTAPRAADSESHDISLGGQPEGTSVTATRLVAGAYANVDVNAMGPGPLKGSLFANVHRDAQGIELRELTLAGMCFFTALCCLRLRLRLQCGLRVQLA
jgi:hypothetical protein